jgi:hypothetical protein
MPAKIRTVDFHFTEQRRAFRLSRKGFTDFVRQHERGLVLAVQIARQLQRTDALHCVSDDADRRHQIGEAHLAAGEDRAARHRKLFTAILAREATARGVVVIERTTVRANRRAIRGRPARLAERLVILVLAGGIDRLKAEGPGLCREKEVLGHCHRFQCLCTEYDGIGALLSRAKESHMMAFAIEEMAMPDTEFEARAKGLLRAEMAKRNLTYQQLVDKLHEMGVKEDEHNLRNKVARGKFTAAFLLQCLQAIGVARLDLQS